MKIISVFLLLILGQTASAELTCHVERQEGKLLGVYQMKLTEDETSKKFYLLLENEVEFVVNIRRIENTFDATIAAWPTGEKASIGYLESTLNKTEHQKTTLGGYTGKTWVFLTCHDE